MHTLEFHQEMVDRAWGEKFDKQGQGGIVTATHRDVCAEGWLLRVVGLQAIYLLRGDHNCGAVGGILGIIRYSFIDRQTGLSRFYFDHFQIIPRVGNAFSV